MLFHIFFTNLLHLVLFLTLGSKYILTTEGQVQKVDNPLPNKNPKTLSIKTTSFRLPENYSKEQRPTQNDEATIVYSNIHVQAINPIKAVDMDFSWDSHFRMDMTLTQTWIDNGLQFANEWFDNKDHLILPLEFVDQIWHPHPFIVNAKSTDVGQRPTNSEVTCAMNYRFYPFDSQLCPTFLESFSFDESQVKFVWTTIDAFTINPKLRMLQFQPRRPLYYGEASVPRFNEGKNFSQLIAYFRFDRLLGNHLIQTFAPCSLVVCLSWFSFWLELNALSARMSLLVTSILTLVTQFAGLKSDLPPVAYIKAVDIWMAGCMVWVFGALGEFVVAKVIYSLTEDAKFNYHESHLQIQLRCHKNSDVKSDPIPIRPNSNRALEDCQPEEIMSPISAKERSRRRRLAGLERRGSIGSISMATTSSASLDKNLGKVHIPLQWTDHKTGKQILLWKKIDNFSKSAFPLTFVIFCTIYWIILYIHSKNDTELDYLISTNATT